MTCDLNALDAGSFISASVGKTYYVDRDSNLCDSTYLQEANGLNTCVSGHPIDSKRDCEIAANYINGATWTDSNSLRADEDFPKGCFRSSADIIIFNNVKRGTARADSALLCRNAKSHNAFNCPGIGMLPSRSISSSASNIDGVIIRLGGSVTFLQFVDASC